MIDDPTAAPIIARALERIGVEHLKRARFAERILHVGTEAMFFLPPPGKRISAEQIVQALEHIEDGLSQLERGLRVIDDARMTVTPKAKQRTESLEHVQRAVLGAITDSVLRQLPAVVVTDEQIADSMPLYGPFPSFRNSWNGAFSLASRRIGKLRASFDSRDFRSPTRDIDERFVRAITALAQVFQDATDRPARAYAPGGDNTNPNWRPPFCQFIFDLWPLLGEPGAAAPSNRRIADALKHAPVFPRRDNSE